MKLSPILLIVCPLLLSACDRKDTEDRRTAGLRTELIIAEARAEALENQLVRANDVQSKSAALITTLQADNARLSSELSSITVEMENGKARMQHMRELGRVEARLEALTAPAPSGYVRPSVTPLPQAVPEPPTWRFPPEYEARKIIRKAAEEKWKENYDMVEHEIEKQTAAHRALQSYEKKRWSDPALRNALNRAGDKWSTNFDMVLYELEKQLNAKQRLDSSR